MSQQPRSVQISSQVDVERARRETRVLAAQIGFDKHDAEAIVLAVSELGTNLLRYAPGGVILVSALSECEGPGIKVASHDVGPGIADIERAMQEGFSTGGGLGGGLPAVRRLMDVFAITSSASGTSIEVCKWLSRPSSSR